MYFVMVVFAGTAEKNEEDEVDEENEADGRRKRILINYE